MLTNSSKVQSPLIIVSRSDKLNQKTPYDTAFIRLFSGSGNTASRSHQQGQQYVMEWHVLNINTININWGSFGPQQKKLLKHKKFYVLFNMDEFLSTERGKPRFHWVEWIRWIVEEDAKVSSPLWVPKNSNSLLLPKSTSFVINDFSKELIHLCCSQTIPIWVQNSIHWIIFNFLAPYCKLLCTKL